MFALILAMEAMAMSSNQEADWTSNQVSLTGETTSGSGDFYSNQPASSVTSTLLSNLLEEFKKKKFGYGGRSVAKHEPRTFDFQDGANVNQYDGQMNGNNMLSGWEGHRS